MAEHKLAPTDIKLHQKSRVLEVSFNDDKTFKLSCEYLRCFSPSAEVRGHASGQEVLQVGKENVNIMKIEPVGTYAVVLHFDDEHNTGIYTWPYLYELGVNREKNWQFYLDQLKKAGIERKP
ncbi:MAG: DUF971 domain-containing protein [Gammaproteobacteria bacterium]|nr:MAG: DUF971 domain-containing protein [Gammaproteobacteria bacterium]